MTTSATSSFTQTCDEIMADALTNVGAIGPGKSATGAIRTHALRALNRVAKSIDASGNFLWRTVRRDIAIVAGTASYGPTIIGTDVLGLEDPCDFRLTGQNARSQVYAMTNADYRLIGDRTSQGTPTQYLVEWTLTGVTLTVWPTPDQAGTLEIMAALRAKDFVAGANTPDYDPKWNDCLILGLSAQLAPAYGQSANDYQARFQAERERLLNNDSPNVGLTLVPWGMSG